MYSIGLYAGVDLEVLADPGVVLSLNYFAGTSDARSLMLSAGFAF